VAHDTRDALVDFVRGWSQKTEIALRRFVQWLGIAASKYYDWRARYGRVNEHNAWIPRDAWLSDEEQQKIVAFHDDYPLEGYRRLAFMMLDRDVVAASPSSVYRALRAAGRLRRWNDGPSRKGKGFSQPIGPHEHWHVDVSYVNISGTFYYLCSVLDGLSRAIVHWELRESMKEPEVELILQRAREKFPGTTPRIISDNGPQFVARDFKAFIRLCGMTHVRTSPHYPQSNGKLERYHRSLKSECIRPGTPLTPDDGRRLVTDYVAHYNGVRLHSAIGYVAPLDRLEGRAATIWAERDRKLAAARERRKTARQAHRDGAVTACQAPNESVQSNVTWPEDRATLGSDPSADPGAKTEGRAVNTAARSSLLRDWHQSGKPRAAQPRVTGQVDPRMCVPETGGLSISG
jgi:transposase InsO family protein